MKKILLVSYGGGHVAMLLPIAYKLRELKYEVVFFALTTAIDKLKQTDFKYYTYKNFFYSEEVQKYGKKLIQDLDTIKLNDEESIAYLGQNYLELVQSYGEQKAEELYIKSNRQIFNPIKSMQYVLEKIKPDLVVSTNSPRSEKCIIQASNKFGIKSVALIDLFAIRCVDWFKKNNFANRIFVFSDSVKSYLVENGRDEKDIKVTGNPVFDELINSDSSENINEIYRVLWASQKEPEYFAEFDTIGNPDLPIEIEEKLFEIFKDKNLQLVVRNHPNEEQRIYPSSVEISDSSTKLIDTLKSVDLVITCTSTVGLEGLILGKDFITIDMSVFTPLCPFSKYGYSKGIDNLDELEKSILDMYNNRFNKKEKKYNIKNATENIVNEIQNLINEK